MRRSLLLGPIIDHGGGLSSVRIGKSLYLLDTDVAEQLRTLSLARHEFSRLHDTDEPFGLARAAYYLLTGRVPGPGDLLVHANRNSKDLRRVNVTPGRHEERCWANLKRTPPGTFNPDAGVTRLGPRRYRARLHLSGQTSAQSLGVYPTRAQARAARIAAYAARIA